MSGDKYPVHYGDYFVGGELADRGTIHGSGIIDIQVDPKTKEVRTPLYCFKPPFPSDGGCAAASVGRSGPSAPHDQLNPDGSLGSPERQSERR